MPILEIYLLHGAAGGWDELIFLLVPLAIVFWFGLASGRGKGGRKPEEPGTPDDGDAAEAPERSRAERREEGEG